MTFDPINYNRPRRKRLEPRGFRRQCSFCGKKTRLQAVAKHNFDCCPPIAYWVPCCRNCWLKSCNRGPLHPAAPGGLVGRP